MLINQRSAEQRLSSPNNLFNKLRSPQASRGLAIFGVSSSRQLNKEEGRISLPKFVASQQELKTNGVKIPEIVDSKEIIPTIDDLIKTDKLDSIHDKALETLQSAVNEIHRRIPEVNKVKDLADIAAKMSKITTDIRSNKSDRSEKVVEIHFYTPEQKRLSDFEALV